MIRKIRRWGSYWQNIDTINETAVLTGGFFGMTVSVGRGNKSLAVTVSSTLHHELRVVSTFFSCHLHIWGCTLLKYPLCFVLAGTYSASRLLLGPSVILSSIYLNEKIDLSSAYYLIRSISRG